MSLMEGSPYQTGSLYSLHLASASSNPDTGSTAAKGRQRQRMAWSGVGAMVGERVKGSAKDGSRVRERGKGDVTKMMVL
eukprot:gene10778-biopygen2933